MIDEKPLPLFSGVDVNFTDFVEQWNEIVAEKHGLPKAEPSINKSTEIKLSNQQLRCRAEGCEAWTGTELGNRQLECMFNGDPLCDEHRTRETLALIHPFAPGLRSIHS